MKHIARVLSCLMNNIESAHMSDQCEERLLEIQYFLARDFRCALILMNAPLENRRVWFATSLDPQLYQACRADAAQKCHYADDWSVGGAKGRNQQGPDPGYLVLTCLYRHAYDEDEKGQSAVSGFNLPTVAVPGRKRAWLQLSHDCALEVRRVLRERAVSVHLLPSVEEACRQDLAEHCSQQTKPGAVSSHVPLLDFYFVLCA